MPPVRITPRTLARTGGRKPSVRHFLMVANSCCMTPIPRLIAFLRVAAANEENLRAVALLSAGAAYSVQLALTQSFHP